MTTKLTILEAGYCMHPERVAIQDGRFQPCRFPASFALIEHPELGVILFDTGYTERFHQETSRFPNKLYALLTPVNLQSDESACEQLRKRGIPPEMVAYIVISHFHADHIAGLMDFPQAKLICTKAAYDSIRGKQGLSALRVACLPGLLPHNMENQLMLLEDHFQPVALPPHLAPFASGYALTADHALLAIELPGHARGHIGLIIQIDHTQTFFLIGDACWLSDNYRRLQMPHPVSQLLHHDMPTYRETLVQLNQLYRMNPDICIVPAHCAEAIQTLKGNTYASRI